MCGVPPLQEYIFQTPNWSPNLGSVVINLTLLVNTSVELPAELVIEFVCGCEWDDYEVSKQ